MIIAYKEKGEIMSTHINNLVEDKLKKIKEEKNVFDTGKVIRLKDYIIEVSGLENVAFFEKVIIRGKGMGYVNEIKENSVTVAVVTFAKASVSLSALFSVKSNSVSVKSFAPPSAPFLTLNVA